MTASLQLCVPPDQVDPSDLKMKEAMGPRKERLAVFGVSASLQHCDCHAEYFIVHGMQVFGASSSPPSAGGVSVHSPYSCNTVGVQ